MENEKKVVKLAEEKLGQVAGGTEFVPDIPTPEPGIAFATCPHCMCQLQGPQSEINAHIASCKGNPISPIIIVVDKPD